MYLKPFERSNRIGTRSKPNVKWDETFWDLKHSPQDEHFGSNLKEIAELESGQENFKSKLNLGAFIKAEIKENPMRAIIRDMLKDNPNNERISSAEVVSRINEEEYKASNCPSQIN
ncbi:hypothetical protein DAPPUDRAFT_329751 [Daphnia pulex]|uniref:Uncharacterized protein n=1 Tax=Daphnia pulex TaxID=6669 RepID=E9HHI3_DAPPU|nr:hypothetical protein DAPPUDRAFT_329751 [Daphnia pulex]|eukprot:EFX68810.1 hypothetical protein DAPPUDRAFT_329751 [Daphnia pulex]